MRVEFDARRFGGIAVQTRKGLANTYVYIKIGYNAETLTLILDDDKAKELARSILEQLGEGNE